jgi:glycosyltransferase involved in cell wall biosynthesis
MASVQRAPEMLVSIVLPTHNGARYIGQSIESCVNQTHRSWELIIVDDGSTDDTAAAIARYADARIRVIRHKKNRGLSAALNTGFASARGDFLTWTSDDNYYHPAALERMLTFLGAHPHVDFVYTDHECVDDAGRVTHYFEVAPPEVLLTDNHVGACFLYRRRVCEVIGPYAEDIRLAEDYDYWLRVSMSFRMAPLHENLYCYRVHPQSLTSRSSRNAVRAAMNRSLARHLPALAWADATAKAAAFMKHARRAQREGRVADVVRYLTLSASAAPSWVVCHAARRLARLTVGVFSR